MRKILIILIMILIIIVSSIIVIFCIKNNLNENERKEIVSSYLGDNYTSIKGTDSDMDMYMSYSPDPDSILGYDILTNNDTCIVLIFFKSNVQRDTIDFCHDFFTKFILKDARALADPYVIDPDIRESLPNKIFRAYIGDTLGIDYQFQQQKYFILNKEIKENIDKVYKQRELDDEFSSYIKSNLKSIGIDTKSIEKSFNKGFLIIKINKGNMDKLETFFNSSEFLNQLMYSRHNFISEIWIIDASSENKIAKINLQ